MVCVCKCVCDVCAHPLQQMQCSRGDGVCVCVTRVLILCSRCSVRGVMVCVCLCVCDVCAQPLQQMQCLRGDGVCMCVCV